MGALLRRITSGLHTLARMARLACGQPDYDAYVAHVNAHHPGVAPMSYPEFFREREAARYRSDRSGRCC